MADKKYRVNWLLQGVGKKDLQAGDTVQLSDDDAKELLEIGVITLAGEKPAEVEQKPISELPNDPPAEPEEASGAT